MENLDISTISSLLTHISNLTGFYLSVHGPNGHLFLPPVRENKIFSAVRSTEKGREEYRDFIQNNLEKAKYRSDVTLMKGPAGQFHFFAPLHVNKSLLILTGGGSYLSHEDFENFLKREGPSYGLHLNQAKALEDEIIIKSYSDIQDTARYIQAIFYLALKTSTRSDFHEKRYRLIKTILGLVSDISLEKQADEIYDILIDILLFLFSADSIAILQRDGRTFRPQRTAGRLKDHLQSLSLPATGIITEVVEKRRHVYTEDVYDTLRLGLSEEVTSIHAFPISYDDRVAAILTIFNSDLPEEDIEIISEFCRVSGFIFGLMELQVIYSRCTKDVDLLNTAASRITKIKEPGMLYEEILEASVHLAEAERGSLMLIDDDPSYLTIKAARGINRRLMGEIKVKAGEGIAGRVFTEGKPVMVENIEKNDWGVPRKRPNYRTGSFISIPLKIGEQTVGVINISDKISGEIFSQDDLSLLRSFASYAVIALERSMYYSLAGHLKELSITDSLTGLFNRRYFEERFFEEIHRSDRHTLSFSLAMIDIDDFKLFNDTEGHLAGDEILKSISNIAKDCLRVIDVIARFGGEEFAVIMPQTEKEEAFLVAERIRKSIKEQIPPTWKTFPRDNITISIGIATFPYDGRDRKELIRNADKALYRGKMTGKDKTILWST